MIPGVRSTSPLGLPVLTDQPELLIQYPPHLRKRRTPMSTNNNFQLKVFTGRANLPLADKIAQSIGDPLGKIELKNFPDGESWARIDEDVRGRDVFIIQPTC